MSVVVHIIMEKTISSLWLFKPAFVGGLLSFLNRHLTQRKDPIADIPVDDDEYVKNPFSFLNNSKQLLLLVKTERKRHPPRKESFN